MVRCIRSSASSAARRPGEGDGRDVVGAGRAQRRGARGEGGAGGDDVVDEQRALRGAGAARVRSARAAGPSARARPRPTCGRSRAGAGEAVGDRQPVRARRARAASRSAWLKPRERGAGPGGAAPAPACAVEHSPAARSPRSAPPSRPAMPRAPRNLSARDERRAPGPRRRPAPTPRRRPAPRARPAAGKRSEPGSVPQSGSPRAAGREQDQQSGGASRSRSTGGALRTARYRRGRRHVATIPCASSDNLGHTRSCTGSRPARARAARAAGGHLRAGASAQARREEGGRGAGALQALAFAAGMLALLAALVSPLDGARRGLPLLRPHAPARAARRHRPAAAAALALARDHAPGHAAADARRARARPVRQPGHRHRRVARADVPLAHPGALRRGARAPARPPARAHLVLRRRGGALVAADPARADAPPAHRAAAGRLHRHRQVRPRGARPLLTWIARRSTPTTRACRGSGA